MDPFRLKEKNLNIAVAVQDGNTGIYKHDPSMVRLFAEIIKRNESDAGGVVEAEISLHKCTKEEIQTMFLSKVKNLSSKEKRAEHQLESGEFLCLDEKDINGKEYDLEIYGESDNGIHRRLDVNYFPCKPIQKTYLNQNRSKTECIVDLKSKTAVKRKLKDTLEYIGTYPQMYIISNQSKINLDKYGDESISNHVDLQGVQFRTGLNTWSSFTYQESILEDNSNPFPGFPNTFANAYSLKNQLLNQPSSMTQYPNYYKITSLEFLIEENPKIVKRRTNKVSDLLANIGGLMRSFTLIIGTFVSYFTSQNYYNLLASKIYVWHKPQSNQTKEELQQKQRKGKQRYHTLMPLQKQYGLRKLKHLFCFCFSKHKKHTDYDEALNKVQKHVIYSLDILTYFRKLRAFGMGLSVLLDDTSMKLIAQKAHTKPLKDISNEHQQRQLVRLSGQDKFLLGLIKTRIEFLKTKNIIAIKSKSQSIKNKKEAPDYFDEYTNIRELVRPTKNDVIVKGLNKKYLNTEPKDKPEKFKDYKTDKMLKTSISKYKKLNQK